MGQSSWREGAAFALAIALWLVAWFFGRLVGAALIPGSWLYATLGGVAGWCIGLGLAALVIILSEMS